MLQVPAHIKAVIFDLDGTLAESMGIWKQIDIDFLGKYGRELPDDLQTKIEGMSFSETAVYFKERFDLPQSTDEMKAEWNQMAKDQYQNHIRLKKGARAFLEALKERKILMGIATSNSMELVLTLLNAQNITPYFSQVTNGCQVGAGKPAPDVYLYTAEKLGVDPKDCLVIEDIPAGILSGKAANMTVWAIEDDYSADLREEKRRLSDGYIEDYTEVFFEEGS